MGNEDNGIALFFQIFQLNEQLRCLLRGENGGRLIHDENSGPSHQGLENFHLLLHANRNVHHFGLRLHMEVELFGIGSGELNRFGLVDENAGLVRHHAQHHVFCHGETWDQHEMLMDHADAVGDCHGG